MDETSETAMTAMNLLSTTWRLWYSRAGMFFLIMGIPIAALGILSVIVVYVISPHAQVMPLREVYEKMGILQKLSVVVVFLASFGMQYHALAASAFATQVIWQGRSVSMWQAIRSVRRKQLRLFWMVMLVCMITGPLGLVAFPFLAFATAPGFPVAILENRPALAAIKRGNSLGKGRQGRIAVLVALWLGLGGAAVVGLVSILSLIETLYGRPWFLRPLPLVGLWFIMLIPQLYMIALTLNYLDQRKYKSGMGSASSNSVEG